MMFTDIPGLHNLYQASKCGNILGVKRGKVLKPTLDRGGYEKVIICIEGRRKCMSVHRLVSKTFDNLYSEDLVINHIDFNRSNNNINNLECVTIKDNAEHSKARAHNARAIAAVRTHSKKYIFTLPCNTEKVGYNLSKFCRENGLSKSSMYRVLRGFIDNWKNYKVRYYGDE